MQDGVIQIFLESEKFTKDSSVSLARCHIDVVGDLKSMAIL